MYSPLALAYIGDGVYEIMIRAKVLSRGNMQVNKMHKKSTSLVKAQTQAHMIRLLEPELTDEELIVLYREKYFDERDPIINYWPHETIPHTIVVEHHSGFKRTFNVFEYPVGKRDQ